MEAETGRGSNFKFRFLFDPYYIGRKLRNIRSLEDFLHRTVNLGRYSLGLLANVCWEIRGFPRGARLRGENMLWKLRGIPRGARLWGENIFWKIRGIPRGARLRGANAFYRFWGEILFKIRRARAPLVLRQPELPQHKTSLGQTALAEKFQTATPFKHVVIDDFFPLEFCRRLSDEFPEYDAARFRNEHRHLGKAHYEKIAELGPSYVELDRYFKSPEFLGLISRITGITDLLPDPEYWGGGAHENLEDMELDPHVDFTLHPTNGLYRRVNLLFYLNSEWDESWGGALELHVNPWLPPERNPIQTISPLFNRCVIFETGDRSWHGFKAIRLPPEKRGLSRRSIALYLYTREDPRGIQVIPEDLTVFVDRPLPPRLKPGHTLTEEDMRLLSRLITRRDWKLEYLYGRAINLFNQWRRAKMELEDARKTLVP